MRTIEIKYVDNNILTITNDKIIMGVHGLGRFLNLWQEDLQEFCIHLDKNVFYKNTLQGKTTLKNGLIKSKLISLGRKERYAVTIIYNIKEKTKNLYPENKNETIRSS